MIFRIDNARYSEIFRCKRQSIKHIANYFFHYKKSHLNEMNSRRFVYCAVITILCVSAGIIALEYDKVKYNKLVSKIFDGPMTDPYFAPDDASENTGKPNRPMDDNCNAVCVPEHLCVNNSVVVDGAGLLRLRISDRIGANGDLDCGMEIECCLNEDDEYEDETEKDNVEDMTNESTDQKETKPITMGCGFRYNTNIKMMSSRISGGVTTHLGDYPWIVAVGLRPQSGEHLEYRGGGSLIHPRVVLTAAHILQNNTAVQFAVRAGEWDMRNTNEEFKHQDRNVVLIVKHSRFNASTLINDIALLITKQPFELTQTVNTICLPVQNFIPTPNTICTASGWGKNVRDRKYQSILRKVDVPFVGREKCKQQLRQTILGKFYRLHPSFVCAGGRKEADVCEGDGGSPLICTLPTGESRFYQIGIVAGGKTIHYS